MAAYPDLYGSAMPAAVPGVGDCNICLQVVPCVKVLDCGHTLCTPCASRLILEAKDTNLTCAECRQLTDVSKGVADLRTLYFGKIRCDVCLERKEAEDTWWCGDCLMALCSKCSITEHSEKKHTISEWNQLRPVQYSIHYLNELRVGRQNSAGGAHNEAIVRAYLAEVEHHLLAQLKTATDLDVLKSSLIARYGTQFSSESGSSGDAPPTPMEDGPRVVAKVLQLAGDSVMETRIPRVSTDDAPLQVVFNEPAAELARLIRTKMDLVPMTASNPKSRLPPTAPPANDHYSEVALPRVGGKVPVLQMIFCSSVDIIAVRTGTEIQLYSADGTKTYGIPGQANKNIRDVCFGAGSGELLVCYQSTLRKFEWSLEAFQLSSFPVTSLYSATLDIDPEDRIEGLRLAITGQDDSMLYEMRLCAQNVTEIWKANLVTKKKGKVKLKEHLICQRPNSAFTALKVVPGSGKERYLFAWDDLSSCLFRLLVKDGHCEDATKILHSSEPVPFCLSTDHRLWLFDPHLHQVCVSRESVLNRENVMFHQVWPFAAHGFTGLYAVRGSVLGLSLTSDHIFLTSFQNPP